jgi:hypothetical protein
VRELRRGSRQLREGSSGEEVHSFVRDAEKWTAFLRGAEVRK